MSEQHIFRGHWFDGTSSTANPAEFVLDSQKIAIRTQKFERSYHLTQVTLEPLIPSLPAKVALDDASNFIFEQDVDVSLLERSLKHRQRGQWIRHFEKSFKVAISALIFIIVGLYAFVTYGIPALADPLSKYIPQQWVKSLDVEIMDLLLEAKVIRGYPLIRFERKLNALMTELNIDADVYHIRVYRSGIGANALALPGGTILVTRKLMKLGLTDNQVKSVLAHEIGHIEHRHGVRGMIQNISVTALFGMLLGDVSAFAQIALVSAPVMLKSLSYTRDFEREADRFSISVLEQNGIPISCLASSLRILQESHQKGTKNSGEDKANVLVDILSTHPDTDERARYSEDSLPCD